ncbi:MAG TPA: glycosyltransferase family A protein [Candidatus Thermoplasmatota archaeon]|nr:glycosyltransferase family A protein [Candidatus Thermoplasmatota archaeon]
MEPRVSACFTHRNEWPVVAKAVGSLIRQLPADVEVVFVDAGSNDGSRAYLESVAARIERFRLVVKERCSRGEGRDSAWRTAQAPLTVHLDADRVWLPRAWSRVEALLPLLAAGPIRMEAPMRYHTTAGLLATRDQLDAVGGYDVSLQHYEDWDLERRLDERWGLQRVPCRLFASDDGRKMRRVGYNFRYYYHMFRDAARTGRRLGHMVRPSAGKPWRYPFVAAGVAGFVQGRRREPARSNRGPRRRAGSP